MDQLDTTHETPEQEQERRLEEIDVGSHWRAHAEQYRKTGTSRDDLVAAFRHARKERPGLSAAEYLKPRRE